MGATLVLALVFLVAISLIVGGLAAWTTNGLKDSAAFTYSRYANNALNSATQLAIQNIRYNPLLGSNQTLNANPPSYCWGSGPTSSLPADPNENDQVAVFCSTIWNPTSAQTRVVTISACLTSNLPGPQAAWGQQCAGQPGQQTVVTFDDYPATGVSAPNPGVCAPSSCGIGMTVNSSSGNPSLPTVSSVLTNTSGTSGAVTGNYPLNIIGTGFVPNATTLSFVDNVPSANVIVPATNFVVNSATSITVSTPALTTVGSYFVAVTTPNGTSVGGPTFNFTAVIPTVTSLTTTAGQPPTGSAAGGTGLEILGSGFLSNSNGDSTAVKFVDTANPGNSVNLPNNLINVVSSNLVIVTTPSVINTDTYYVIVTTAPGGTSASGPVFSFTALTPVVASINPTTASHAGGTTVTITGIGFIAGTGGSVVTFVQGGTTLTATNVVVQNSTTLTAVTPAGTLNATYSVFVTTSSGGSSGAGGTPTILYNS